MNIFWWYYWRNERNFHRLYSQPCFFCYYWIIKNDNLLLAKTVCEEPKELFWHGFNYFMVCEHKFLLNKQKPCHRSINSRWCNQNESGKISEEVRGIVFHYSCKNESKISFYESQYGSCRSQMLYKIGVN